MNSETLIMESGSGDPSEVLVNIQVADDTVINPDMTADIIKNWQDAVGSTVVPTSSSIPNQHSDKWALDLDSFTMVLAEKLNGVFQELPAFTLSLRYEALLGVTVDNDTTFVFSLQGVAGPASTKLTGWTRRWTESNQIKIKIEEALSGACWEQAVSISSLRIEGTISIIVDNKDVFLVHLDQITNAPGTQAKKKNKTVSITCITDHMVHETYNQDIPSTRRRKNVKESAKDAIRIKMEETTKDLEEDDEPQVEKILYGKTSNWKSAQKNNNSENLSQIKKEKENTWVCEECGKSFDNKSGLSKHTRKMHREGGAIACTYEGCTKVFLAKSQLREHEVCHTGVKNYLCVKCGKKFGHSSTLSKHRRFICGGKPHKCELCNRHFKFEEQLSEHRLCHGTFECEICSKTFQMEDRLRFHIRKIHGTCPDSKKPVNHSNRKRYSCHLCEKSYTCGNGLARHLLVHKNERNYSCEICGKSFIDKGYHKEHMELHNEESPYSCEFCGRAFKWQKYLKRHRRVHTGEMPYNCRFCNKAFKYTSSLAQHKKKCMEKDKNGSVVQENETVEIPASAV